MVLFPLSPCLSRILLASVEFNCTDSILIIAAMLSVEDVFLRPGDRKKFSKACKVWAELATSAGGNNDFFTLLYIFEECFKRCVRFYKVLVLGPVFTRENKHRIGSDWTFFHLVLSASPDQNKVKILYHLGCGS